MQVDTPRCSCVSGNRTARGKPVPHFFQSVTMSEATETARIGNFQNHRVNQAWKWNREPRSRHSPALSLSLVRGREKRERKYKKKLVLFEIKYKIWIYFLNKKNFLFFVMSRYNLSLFLSTYIIWFSALKPDIFRLYNLLLHVARKLINLTQRWQYWRKHETFDVV